MSSPAAALELLRDIEQRTIRVAAPLPLNEDVRPDWRGLGFQLGGLRLLSNIGEAFEVLSPPRLTTLPGVAEWVLGVANVRGRLVPVVDLHRLLGLTPTAPRVNWRVLLVEDGDLLAGLLVEQVLGMQQFPVESFDTEVPADIPSVGPFVDGTCRQAGRVWYLFNLVRLVRDQRFMDVSRPVPGDLGTIERR